MDFNLNIYKTKSINLILFDLLHAMILTMINFFTAALLDRSIFYSRSCYL